MIRFALPLSLLIISIALALLFYFIVKRLKHGVKSTLQKGADIANEQQQKWQQKEQRKKLPTIVQKGFNDLEQIDKAAKQLPEQWRASISPLVSTSHQIINALSAEEKISDSKINSIRPFFNHSLDALKKFIDKINSDSSQMDSPEISKAKENINILKADLAHHQNTIHKKRKLDFDVLMDVIKARLKR